MPDLQCEVCGEGFWRGRGRPAHRCPRCRGTARYGPQHRQLRAATVGQAYGKPCARCGLPMLAGQPVQLDHADGGGPNKYVGYSHRSCNARAGAVNGNRARAAAYRAMKGTKNGPGTAETADSAPETAEIEAKPTPGEYRLRDGGGLEVYGAAGWNPVSRRW
jgi:hypothetical protein